MRLNNSHSWWSSIGLVLTKPGSWRFFKHRRSLYSRKGISVIRNIPAIGRSHPATAGCIYSDPLHPGKGHFDDWKRYAQQGLFAFDNQDVHREDKLRQYDLIAMPAMPVQVHQLPDVHLLKTIIPQLDISFGSDVAFDQLQANQVG